MRPKVAHTDNNAAFLHMWGDNENSFAPLKVSGKTATRFGVSPHIWMCIWCFVSVFFICDVNGDLSIYPRQSKIFNWQLRQSCGVYLLCNDDSATSIIITPATALLSYNWQPYVTLMSVDILILSLSMGQSAWPLANTEEKKNCCKTVQCNRHCVCFAVLVFFLACLSVLLWCALKFFRYSDFLLIKTN